MNKANTSAARAKAIQIRGSSWQDESSIWVSLMTNGDPSKQRLSIMSSQQGVTAEIRMDWATLLDLTAAAESLIKSQPSEADAPEQQHARWPGDFDGAHHVAHSHAETTRRP
ncbi:MAG: hypothetical protein AB7E55_30145 [Pigmentiphaga sp.]